MVQTFRPKFYIYIYSALSTGYSFDFDTYYHYVAHSAIGWGASLFHSISWDLALVMEDKKITKIPDLQALWCSLRLKDQKDEFRPPAWDLNVVLRCLCTPLLSIFNLHRLITSPRKQYSIWHWPRWQGLLSFTFSTLPMYTFSVVHTESFTSDCAMISLPRINYQDNPNGLSPSYLYHQLLEPKARKNSYYALCTHYEVYPLLQAWGSKIDFYTRISPSPVDRIVQSSYRSAQVMHSTTEQLESLCHWGQLVKVCPPPYRPIKMH